MESDNELFNLEDLPMFLNSVLEKNSQFAVKKM